MEAKMTNKKKVSIRNWTFGLRVMTSLIFLSILATTHINATQVSEITPNHAYSVMELVDRSLDMIIKLKNISNYKEIKLLEKGLRPMHTYQMAISCIDSLIEYQRKQGIPQLPKVVAIPRVYIPADVMQLGQLLLNGLRDTFPQLLDASLEPYEFTNKVPTDVFGKAVSIFVKIKVLSDVSNITPNETYAESVRVVSDVKSILSQIDPAQRYRIDAPVSPSNLTPSDVFQECLLLRQDINKLAEHLKLTITPIPEVDKNATLHPADVFIQLQVIIAELNLLKMGTGTISSTPLAIPVSGKTPSDVHQQVVLARYLLAQILPLREMISKTN